MKKLFILCAVLLLAACSGGGAGDESANDVSTSESMDKEMAASTEESEAAQTEEMKMGQTAQTERMVAYESHLQLAVKNVESVLETFEEKVKQSGGYVVESSISTEGSTKRAYLQARVPSGKFDSYLAYVEENSERVIDRNVRGEDVTEEYVDLESRLKAKRTVEKRLLSFMEKAEKTEDLLKISNDLARVQEEIEQVEGRMKYLKNRTDYALVSLSMEDTNVKVPKVKDNEELQTGQKIKQAFASSINGIAVFFSAIAVFLIGFSPVLLIIGVVGGVVYLVMKKRRKK
ncbi:DUF4349 domain-containing protein [Bacillus tianshenii]|nr:DUF4349 domain-containing protein [Bacillus tianshenii]